MGSILSRTKESEDKCDKMKITILGARGSVPTGGPDTFEFGGCTSCVLVETEKDAVFLDAGTGITHTPDIGNKQISILITHPHFDHIMGMPFFPYNAEKGRHINVYGKRRGDESIRDQITRLISPPLWPCTLADYKADYVFFDLDTPFSIGNITIDSIESEHPGGSLIYKISEGKKSMVYATDYEYSSTAGAKLSDFSEGVDLLLIDAQYTDEEAAVRKGFGHSTVEAGQIIMKEADVRKIRYVHHDPRHSDEKLRAMENMVKSDRVAFAREGEVIDL